MTYRELSAQALADQDYDAFLTELQKSLTDGRRDPNEVVRDTLFEIYYGAAQPDRENLSLAARAAVHSLDPRNIATEPEYYTDIDQADVRSFAARTKLTVRTPFPPDARADDLSQRRRQLQVLAFC